MFRSDQRGDRRWFRSTGEITASDAVYYLDAGSLAFTVDRNKARGNVFPYSRSYTKNLSTFADVPVAGATLLFWFLMYSLVLLHARGLDSSTRMAN